MSSIPDHTQISDLRNCGPASASLLAGIDVYTVGDVRRLGIPMIMHILRQHNLPASMNLAFALEAGLRDEHWLELDKDVKDALRKACSD